MKRPKLKRDWIGLTVKTVCELRNGYTCIPPGTVCKVADYCRGLKLKTAKCPHCGLAAYITRVPERDVVIVSEQTP